MRAGRIPDPSIPARAGDPMLLLTSLLAVVLLIIGAAFALSAPGAPLGPVLLYVITVGCYLAAGLIAWRRRPHNRIGLLMILTGLSIWLSGLVDAPLPFLPTIGVAAQTLPLALTLHLLLAFPSGRVHGRFARVLVTVGYVTCTVLQMPLYLIGEGPVAVWNSARAQSLVVGAGWAQTTVGVFSVSAAAVIVAVRALRSDPLERRQLGPIVWYRILFPLVIAVSAVIFRASTDPWAIEAALFGQSVAILGLPLVFLIGLLFGSFGRAGEVNELVARIGATTPAAGELTAAVAMALGDPEAVVVFARSDADGFVDESGRDVVVPSTQQLYPVQHNGATVGGILHRDSLIADPSLMSVLAGIVAMGIDTQRLAAEQRALLGDLRAREADLHASRRRLLQAEDTERRRISRDLHDGAQQHIVLLGLTARRLSRSAADPGAAASAASIADGMSSLLTEFRDLVAGIMPAPLADRGLVPAIELLAERMSIPTTVVAPVLTDRLAADAESTVYFAVSEALTNVVKHASATAARVEIARVDGASGPRLAAAVLDDGVGGADCAAGTGLCGLVDRIEALGGTMWVESAAGSGTAVRLEIPCA